LAAQLRVVETAELGNRTSLDSARDQLGAVTEQYRQARQHATAIDVRRPSIAPSYSHGSGVARNFRQGLHQSLAVLSVHSRSAALRVGL